MITLADAKRVLAAAERKAEEIAQPMNIAVVDAGGACELAGDSVCDLARDERAAVDEAGVELQEIRAGVEARACVVGPSMLVRGVKESPDDHVGARLQRIIHGSGLEADGPVLSFQQKLLVRFKPARGSIVGQLDYCCRRR